jgi:hypothetical protein
MNPPESPADAAATERAFWQPADPNSGTWSELLCADPLIIQATASTRLPVGSAGVIGPLVRDREAHFLLMLIEPPYGSCIWIDAAESYLADHRLHRLTFLTNTEREQQLMADAGCEAITLNQNCLLDDAAFHPLPDIEPVYDAVYNARLSPEKRPQLAVEIERLAFIYSYGSFEFTVPQFHHEHVRLRAMMPAANFVNKLTPQGCEWLPAQRVNEVLARSRVGLCLSAVEGKMRASIEYLFAGLSVVSTPSLGGRDYYFDDEYCIIAEPNPRSIREAVEALIRRAVPREYVRAKTLARVEVDRARYIALVQGLIDRERGSVQFADRFRSLIHGQGILPWRRSMSEFASAVVAEVET